MTLYETVKQEMVKMLARNLPYSPKAEELPQNISVMTQDLESRGLMTSDSERVRTSFQRIANEVGKWPAAFMVFEHLPDRPEYKKIAQKPEMPRKIKDNLKTMGLERQEDEGRREYAERCKAKAMKESMLPDNLRR